jgi:hypothetical protein
MCEKVDNCFLKVVKILKNCNHNFDPQLKNENNIYSSGLDLQRMEMRAMLEGVSATDALIAENERLKLELEMARNSPFAAAFQYD